MNTTAEINIVDNTFRHKKGKKKQKTHEKNDRRRTKNILL